MTETREQKLARVKRESAELGYELRRKRPSKPPRKGRELAYGTMDDLAATFRRFLDLSGNRTPTTTAAREFHARFEAPLQTGQETQARIAQLRTQILAKARGSGKDTIETHAAALAAGQPVVIGDQLILPAAWVREHFPDVSYDRVCELLRASLHTSRR